MGTPTPLPATPADRRLAAVIGFITARLEEHARDRASDITACRRLLAHLTQLADVRWTGSYAVREEAVASLAALASLFADHPDYQQEWNA